MTKPMRRAGHRRRAIDSTRPIVRLWREPRRVEQRARLKKIRVQTCDVAGKSAWEQAALICRQLPEGVRVDLPSPRVFARVLGVYFSAEVVKKRPMTDLELSAKELADLVGYGKTAVEAALRWLGCDPIIYCGQQVARGLGYISRVRRKAKAYIKGVLQSVYRTSRSSLTLLGRGLVELLPADQDSPRPVTRDKWGRSRSSRRHGGPKKGQAASTEPSAKEVPNWEGGLRALRAMLI